MREALNRPVREVHPEIAAALAAKTDLLLSGVAVDDHANVAIERGRQDVRGKPVGGGQASCGDCPPGSCARWLTESRRKAWRGTWRSPSCNRGYLSAAEAVQAAKLHSEMLPEQQAIMLGAGGPGTGTSWDGLAQVSDRTATECAVEDGHGVTARRHA